MWSFVGAVVFGAAATSALVGGITFFQEALGGVERNLALTAFHAVLRFGLALAALLAGARPTSCGRPARPRSAWPRASSCWRRPG